MNPFHESPQALIARYQTSLGEITELLVPSIHVFAHLLELQRSRGIAGDMLEIGVFRGGTASLIASALNKDERLFLVDPHQDATANRRTIESFAQLGPEQLHFHLIDSVAINKWRERLLSPAMPLVRFVHIDGEHSYDAVYSDLDLARRYLTGGGLIVLDDIFNMNSACCTHALFDYLKEQPLLQLAAMGLRKAYLCESRYLASYRRFFIDLPKLLAQTAGLHVRLCFNSWAQERSYVTFDECGAEEAHYQIIGKRFHALAEALAAMEAVV